jgi:hypothetical protein
MPIILNMDIHGCKLFPEPAEVFLDQVEEHRAVLLPFMIMPLNLIVPGSPIQVPWVIPYEPYEGCVGQSTQKYHTFFSRENWIGFHLENGKLNFDGDLAYFLKHQVDHLPLSQRTFSPDDGIEETCIENHQEIEKWFEKRREYFRKGPISLMESHYVRSRRINHEKFKGMGIFDQLGGNVGRGNWATRQEEPYFRESSDYPEPVDEKGRCLIYLGTIRPGINHADRILGFINEDLNHIVFTFDFS